MKPIDLRSDTVTRPTAAMRAAMHAAELGDDVFGDDPTVNKLQRRIADMLGFEAALFFPTGTQSNLCALLSHCARGEEYIVGQNAHTYRMEGGGAAVLGGIQPQPIEHAADGTLPLTSIEANIKPDDAHFARTRLLALENTHGGRVMPLHYLQEATTLARSHGLSTHLDGARLFNAAVASGGDAKASARAIAQCFDSVSICFSKGLGTPAGSTLVTRWTITSSAWPSITPTRSAWPTGCAPSRASASHRPTPTSSSRRWPPMPRATRGLARRRWSST
jgi:threonine aldolase